MKLPSGLYKSQPFQCKLYIGSYKTRPHSPWCMTGSFKPAFCWTRSNIPCIAFRLAVVQEWESFHQEWDGTGEKIHSHVVLFLPGGGRCSSSSPAQPSTDLTQITSLASCYWLLLSLMPLWIAANRRVESHHILHHCPGGRAVFRHAVPLIQTAEKLTCRCATRTYGETIK